MYSIKISQYVTQKFDFALAMKMSFENVTIVDNSLIVDPKIPILL